MIAYWIKKRLREAAETSGLGVLLPNKQPLITPAKGQATIEFTSWKPLRAIAFKPSLALGEAYANGQMIIHDGDLYDALKPLMLYATAKPDIGMSQWTALLSKPIMLMKDGRWKTQSAHNIHVHYDLGNAFYRLFLDQDMQYSCAYFSNPDMASDLTAAQQAKKAHIIKKLCLNPHKDSPQTVLDIGCGWGGMAETLAKDHGAKVTGITLSHQQVALAKQRLAGSDLPVEIALQDYRDVTETYDRIVSVGMFEHVGRRQFPTYFQIVDRLLNNDGVALIHTIGNTKTSRGQNPFISKYIFPGGYIPKLSEIMAAVEHTNLKVTDIEVWHDHYAKTLRHWRQGFMARRDEALTMFDERFCRLWEFYLVGCELAFSHSNLVVYQLQLTRSKGVVPITRDYLYS
ncbi:MAG: class I SAM-dependent methyltransferase [Alphaproteobacteria bacterium]|nr:class I SAM-dependent methyltransferase [Alphaproteobacteria bacterium]